MSHSCAVQHVSEGDCWAVVSWLKALLHLLIAALTSELLKVSWTDPSSRLHTLPAVGRITSIFSDTLHHLSLYSLNLPPAIFPMFVKSFCLQPQLSVPWEQGIQQPSVVRDTSDTCSVTHSHSPKEILAPCSWRLPLSLHMKQGQAASPLQVPAEMFSVLKPNSV